MTLHELLRTHVRELQDTLQLCENSIRDLGLHRGAELAQLEVLKTEIDLNRRDENQKCQLLQGAEAKVRNVDKQIQELIHIRDGPIEEIQTLNGSLTGAEDELTAFLGQRKKVTARADHLERKIREFAGEKERLQNRLRSARLTAFRVYIEDLEMRLHKYIESQEEKIEKIESRTKLEQARHEDTEVMNLYEARTELQNLLKLSNVTAVRDQLQQGLCRIESQIDALFPGALAIEDCSEAVSQIEEIFFLPDRDGPTQIILPISIHTWDTLAKGEFCKAAPGGLRLIYSLAKGLGSSTINARLKSNGMFVLLEVDNDLATTLESHGISMPLPDSGAMLFVLSKLPHEVQEAIRHEGSNN